MVFNIQYLFTVNNNQLSIIKQHENVNEVLSAGFVVLKLKEQTVEAGN